MPTGDNLILGEQVIIQEVKREHAGKSWGQSCMMSVGLKDIMQKDRKVFGSKEMI